MADVMVVAIFMAYIGFNGIVDSQFDELRSAGQGTGDLDCKRHFPSAGVLPIPDIHPVGVIFVRIPNQKTSGL